MCSPYVHVDMGLTTILSNHHEHVLDRGTIDAHDQVGALAFTPLPDGATGLPVPVRQAQARD